MRSKATKERGPRRKFDPLLVFGILFLVAIVLFAIFGPLVRSWMLRTPGQPLDSVYDPVGMPFLSAGGKYVLGTDDIGRDLMARLAAGARISLFVGFLVQIISLSVGVTVGVLGEFAPRWVAVPLMRLTDGMFAFPDILLAILIIGVIGPGLVPVIVALSITAWPSVARLVKTYVASLKDREYVIASKATGASTFYLVTRHVLPQLWNILLAVSMIEVAGTILAESSLSFLGIGVQAPTPSWGGMINAARGNLNSYPMLLFWPCIILSLTIFALNFVGDGLRAALDPKGQ